MSGTFLVSLDFELYWGMQEVVPFEEYKENVLGGRRAIPRLLRLFREHDIHATWAAVGFMFADSKEEARSYFPRELPTYQDPKMDSYRWFERAGENEEQAPCFFAPSLIRMIADTPGQELGSHSFSHYYCRAQGQTVEQFRQDMLSAKKIAEDKGYHMTSVILPRDYCEREYTCVLQELGFTAYRDEANDWIHKKVKFGNFRRALQLIDVYLPITGYKGVEPFKEDGVWNFDGVRMYKAIRPAIHFLEGLKLHRIKMQMRYAAKHNGTFHLWWHPHNVGVRTEEHMQQLEEILSYYDLLKDRYGFRSLTMQQAAEHLENGTY